MSVRLKAPVGWPGGIAPTLPNNPERTSAGGPLRISSDMPGADLAYTWRGPSTDPGVPAASARSSGRGRFSRAAARIRSPSARRAAASPSWRPAPPLASAPGRLPPHYRRAAAAASPAAAAGDLDPDHAAGGPDCDRLPFRARAAMPDAVPEQLPGSAASSPHGCPGPSTPAVNARATRARSARPATVTLSRTTALATSAPASPARPRPGKPPGTAAGHTGMHARPGGPRQAGKRRRRGPSVAVRETADGAHRP
jgi:hypothetical protein